MRPISGIHILLFTTENGPTPKTQNLILDIYIATKFQDPSRLLRLAELVWLLSARNYFVEREPKHWPGHSKTLPVRPISGIHILLFTTENGPTPKTQNLILDIYIATKFQDPSRLLRLAELVWLLSARNYFVEREPKHWPGHSKTRSVRPISGIHMLLFTTKKGPRPKTATPHSRHLHSYKITGPI